MNRPLPRRALVVVMVSSALAWGSTWTASAQLGGLLGGTHDHGGAHHNDHRAADSHHRAASTTTTVPAPAGSEGGSPDPDGAGTPDPSAAPGAGGSEQRSPAGGSGEGPAVPPPVTRPPRRVPPAPPHRAHPTPSPLPPASDDGEAPPPDAGAFPPHLRALMDSIDRTGSRTTRALVEALAPLAEFSLTPEQAAVVGFGRFPVRGRAAYSHDWWFPRFGLGWRLHQGTDIFAARGTPVRAPVDGSVRIRNSGLGGLSVYVTGADGTYYYLAHLAGIAPGLADGVTVRTGDVVGDVGDSGNARGGMPDVHLEIHPGGGGPVDPKPILDRYLAEAIAAAPEVVAAYAEASASEGRRPVVPEHRPVDAVAMASMRSTLLWVTSVTPAVALPSRPGGTACRRGGRLGRDRTSAPGDRTCPGGDRRPGRRLAAPADAASRGGRDIR